MAHFCEFKTIAVQAVQSYLHNNTTLLRLEEECRPQSVGITGAVSKTCIGPASDAFVHESVKACVSLKAYFQPAILSGSAHLSFCPANSAHSLQLAVRPNCFTNERPKLDKIHPKVVKIDQNC